MARPKPAPKRAARDDKDKGRRSGRRKFCYFCVNKIDELDYKDLVVVRRFVNDKNKISARRSTGTCAKHQRRVAEAIKRGREMALLAYCTSR